MSVPVLVALPQLVTSTVTVPLATAGPPTTTPPVQPKVTGVVPTAMAMFAPWTTEARTT